VTNHGVTNHGVTNHWHYEPLASRRRLALCGQTGDRRAL